MPRRRSWNRLSKPDLPLFSGIAVPPIGTCIPHAGKRFAKAAIVWRPMLALYGERVPPFDLQIARRWAQLSAALDNDSADPMISATALEHGLTVVIRNV